MEVMCNNFMPGDSRLVEQLVSELKSQGIFDQFRKECISDVDTKPAYQNLRQRVEGSVTTFLNQQVWSVDMNKNQLREQLRKNLHESGFLETGVERIVDQVVNPKINTIFLPKVEEVVYRFLGIKKPVRNVKKEVKEVKVTITDLLPTDLEAISPESVHSFKTESKKDGSDILNDSLPSSKLDEDESPPFEPLHETNENGTLNDDKMLVDENTRDSHLSGFSGLESHDSNNGSDMKSYHMELSNQESQVSQNSSESHLSIVTSEDTSKMEICDDSNIDTKMDTKMNKLEITEDIAVESETIEKESYKFEEINENKIVPDENGKSIDKKYEKSDERKPRSSEKSSKDKKDDRHRKSSSSSSKDKDKSSSKYSSQSKNKESKDKDKKDSKSSSSSREKEKNKERSDKEKYDKDKDKSFKYKEKSENKEKEKDRIKSEKVKTDKTKSDKESANKVEKDKAEKEKSKDRFEKSKSDKEKGKSEKDKSIRDKEKSEKEKGYKDKDKYKEKTEKKSKEKSDKDKEKTDKDKERLDKDKERFDKDKERSDRDKEKTSKEKSSKEKSSSSKDKHREESKETKEKIKEDGKETSKDKSRSSSGSVKHSSSSSSSKDKKPSTSKRESSSQNIYKEKSSSSSSSLGDSKSKSLSEKPKKEEANDKHSSNKKDKDRETKKKSKDDHYSSKTKRTDRRSTDRDSNDGQSSKNYFNTFSESASSKSENNAQNYSSSSFTGGSGDSSNSDQVENMAVDSNKTNDIQNNTIEVPKVKYMKPKFALNFEEARKIMKIRKQLAMLEKQNQLSLAKIEIPIENGIGHKYSEKEDVTEEKENINSKHITESSSIETVVNKITENKQIHTFDTQSATHDLNKAYEPDEMIRSIDTKNLSKENWDALEAKLAQVMAEVNYNAYDSDDEFEFHGYSSVDAQPNHMIDLSLDLVKKTEMEMLSEMTYKRELAPKDCQKTSDIDQSISNDFVEKLLHELNGNQEQTVSNEQPPPMYTTVSEVDGKITPTEYIQDNLDGVKRQKTINNVRQLSGLPNEKVVTETECDECHYLEKPTQYEEKYLRYIVLTISKLRKEVEDLIQASKNNFWPSKRGRKRKCEEYVDVKNNNKTTYMETDITPNEQFSLPLSPAESDKSGDRKDEDLLIPTKQKRIFRGYSQRYTSDDLYKPRPVIGGRRNKFPKNTG